MGNGGEEGKLHRRLSRLGSRHQSRPPPQAEKPPTQAPAPAPAPTPAPAPRPPEVAQKPVAAEPSPRPAVATPKPKEAPKPSLPPRPQKKVFLCESHGNNILKGLNAFRFDETLCDVTLVPGDSSKSFPVHRAIMASASDYFKAMFTGGMREQELKEIKLHGVSGAGLKNIIEFIYTSRLDLSVGSLQDTLEAASFLQVLPVLDFCNQLLSSEITIDNCVEVERMAADLLLEDVQTHVGNFVRDNFAELLRNHTGRYLQLSEASMAHALSSDGLKGLSEMELYRAARAWIAHDPGARRPSAYTLLRHIRFPLMTPSELLQISQEDDQDQGSGSGAGAAAGAGGGGGVPGAVVVTAVGVGGGGGGLNGGAAGGRYPGAGGACGFSSAASYSDGSVTTTSAAAAVKISNPNLTTTTITRAPPEPPLMRSDTACVNLLLEASNYQMLPFMQPALQTERTRIRSDDVRLLTLGGVMRHQLVVSRDLRFFEDEKEEYEEDAAGGGVGVGGATAGPGAGSWQALQPMEVPRYQHGVALLGGFLFIVGGQSTYDTKGKTAVDSAYRYDPRFDRWLQIAALNEKRTFFHLSALNGRLYAVGGRNATGEIGSVECYSLNKNEWTFVTPMVEAHYGHAGAVHGGLMYVSGGITKDTFQKEMWCYEPERDRWSRRADMMELRGLHCMCTVGHRLYVMGGNHFRGANDYDDVLSCEYYSPTHDQWTAVAPMPRGQSDVGVSVFKGKVYVVGGYSWNSRCMVDIVQCYDPERDEWEHVFNVLEPLGGIRACTMTVHRPQGLAAEAPIQDCPLPTDKS